MGIRYPRFGRSYQSHIQGSKNPRRKAACDCKLCVPIVGTYLQLEHAQDAPKILLISILYRHQDSQQF
jgi:hypothetical protein